MERPSLCGVRTYVRALGVHTRTIILSSFQHESFNFLSSQEQVFLKNKSYLFMYVWQGRIYRLIFFRFNYTFDLLSFLKLWFWPKKKQLFLGPLSLLSVAILAPTPILTHQRWRGRHVCNVLIIFVFLIFFN